MTRPPDSTSRLATCLASTTGLRCGRMTIPVASLIVVVCAAAQVSATRESRIGSCGAIGDGGACGSGSTTCSPAHTEAKPAASAARAADTRASGLLIGPMLICMSPSRMLVYFNDNQHTPPEGAGMDRTERREFVRKHRTCIFGYNRQNDGPAMTVVYYVLDGDDLLISTMAARGKALAVKRDPKVSLCILDEQWPLTYLQVYGDATLEEDFGQAVDVLRRVIDLMAEKDVTSAKLPEIEQMAREENRVVIRIRPYATFATPPRHVYKAEDIDTLTHFTSNSQPW